MRFLRSLVRVTVATATLLVLLSLATYFGLRSYGHRRLELAVQAFTSRCGPLDPAASALQPVEDHRNAAVFWVRAASRVHLVGEASNAIVSGAVFPRHHWEKEVVEGVPPALELNDHVFALLDYAAALPESNFQLDYGLGQAASATPVIGLIGSARLVAVRARLQIADARLAEGLRSLHTLSRLATALEGEIDIVLQHAGWTAESLLLRIVAELIENGELDPAQLRGLLDGMPEVDIERGFERFLSWELASVTPIVTSGETGQWSWSPWADEAVDNRWEQAVVEMTRELRTARELEERLREMELLALPATELLHGVRTDAAADRPNLGLFAGRMQTVASSRLVVRTALELQLLQPTEAEIGRAVPEPIAVVPLTGGELSVERQADGVIEVGVPGAHRVTAVLFPNRIKPPPPLVVKVP